MECWLHKVDPVLMKKIKFRKASDYSFIAMHCGQYYGEQMPNTPHNDKSNINHLYPY